MVINCHHFNITVIHSGCRHLEGSQKTLWASPGQLPPRSPLCFLHRARHRKGNSRIQWFQTVRVQPLSHMSIYLSIFLSICLSVYLSFYLSLSPSSYPANVREHEKPWETCLFASGSWSRLSPPRSPLWTMSSNVQKLKKSQLKLKTDHIFLNRQLNCVYFFLNRISRSWVQNSAVSAELH